MEFFKLASDYRYGRVISGIKEALWVERYDTPGEFTLTFSPATKDVMQFLPLGSLISHTSTREPMFVETHEIKEEEGEASVLEVRGRGFISFYENRVAIPDDYYVYWAAAFFALPANTVLVGTHNPNNPDKMYNYFETKNYAWQQAKKILEDHTAGVLNAAEALPNVVIYNQVVAAGGEITEYTRIKRQPVWDAVYELLLECDGGIKVNRPLLVDDTGMDVIVHRGVDKSATTQFTPDDVKSQNFVKSIRDQKNAGIYLDRFIGREFRPAGVTGFDLRVGYSEGTDVDYNPVVGGTVDEKEQAVEMALRRAKKIVRKNKKIKLSTVEIKPKAKLRYRVDYAMGDIVYVNSKYEDGPMRVVENVEGFDDQGAYSYPVLRELP